MSPVRWIGLAMVGVLLTAGCATEVVVTAQQSDQLAGAPVTPAPGDPGGDPTTPADDDTLTGSDDAPADPGPGSTDADTDDADPDAGGSSSQPPPDETVATEPPAQTRQGADVDEEAIDFGRNKPSRPYDEFLLATVTDLEAWWSEQYPQIYGAAFRPLQGDIYAAYPERRSQLPGCGQPRTSYDEVNQFVAFYCGDGDFIIYDDGPNSLLTQLAEQFGPATLGIVIAHEYGHAIQLRNGALAERLPTITTEQQADCFAGAWAGRAFRGESPWVVFGDADVRSGLIAMMEVRDPVGFDQTDPGGHGSGFDRVNAFQEGFNKGPARCAALVEDPLPLVPNEFLSSADFASGGNAPLTFDDNGLLTFLPADLNLYWDRELDEVVPGFDGLSVALDERIDDVSCTDPVGDFEDGAVLCPSTSTVHLNGPVVAELHSQSSTFGDFSVGYLLATAWSEAVQRSLGSPLRGEPRQLRNDCLTGAWVNTVIPVPPDLGLPEPRHPERTAVVSPGDLDEAIRTQIRIGDGAADENDIGTPFEKIESFRTGVLGGLDACGI